MSEIFTVICALLGVIGLIFITYFATRWLNKKFRNVGYNGSQNGIKIVECLGISQDKQLIVVRVGNKKMLLGVTPDSIRKLSDLDEEDMALVEKKPDENSEGSFMENLKKAFLSRNNGESSGISGTDAKQEDSYGKNDKDEF